MIEIIPRKEDLVKATREEIIINNILSQVCECCDIPNEQYIPWLTEEVGLTEAEIERLQAVNCLPMPM